MPTIRCVINRRIQEEEICRQLWEIYGQSFKDSEVVCAQNQHCYTKKNFWEALMDEDFTKFYVLYDDQIIAYTLTTNNLEKARITYMNPEKYLATFPEYAPNQIYYFTSIAVLPEFRKSVFLYELLAPVARHINALNGIMAFDFSHETVKNLPDTFLRILRILYKKGLLSYNYSYQRVGIQEFGALIPQKLQ